MTRHELERELEAHHEASFGWALACCRWNRDEANDVLQSSYLKILDGRAVFEGRAQFRTWLFGVIRLTALEHRRSASHQMRRLHEWLLHQHRTRGTSPDASLVTNVEGSNECLRRALSELSPRQREVLHLVFYSDMTIEEASRVIGISLGSARTHYERGKQKLHRLISRQGER